MHRAPDGNIPQRQGVAQVGRGVSSAVQRRADGQSIRTKNIAFLAVLVLEQSQTGGADRIVLNGDYLRFEAEPIALEVHCAHLLLVTLSAPPAGYASVGVASAGFLPGVNQAFFRLPLGNVLVR